MRRSDRQVRVVRYENNLTQFLGFTDTFCQYAKNAVIIEIIFGLVDNERCLFFVEMKVEDKEKQPFLTR